MTPEYAEFLASKAPVAPMTGIEPPPLSSHLMTQQAVTVDFALRAGRAGAFLDTGLGKTGVELEFCRHAGEATNGRSLICAPLAVAPQIAREGKRFGYDARVIRSEDDAREGINIVNYDRLHLIDAGAYGGTALDESGIIKNFTGKTTRTLIDLFAQTRFKLSATATPAPNDFMELGQHAEFLSVMQSIDMLTRWFINDTSTASQHWRLKGHARGDFWDWMASWSRMAMMPSDLGGSDEGFVLPPLEVVPHFVDDPDASAAGLLGLEKLSATEIHATKRRTAALRAALGVELAMSDAEPCVIWVDTDYEADAVKALCPEIVEVRGSQPAAVKERNLEAFADGTVMKLLTKPSIAGFGLNWQHCNHPVYVGRSFSYEAWYQTVRRFWRFGQTRPVRADLVVADGERSIGRVIDRKAGDHRHMQEAMVAAMKRALGRAASLKVAYEPRHRAPLPEWMRAA